MIKWVLPLLLAVSVLISNPSQASPSSCARCPVDYRCESGGGGDGIPDPFPLDMNQRVDLADSEVYQLEGKIVFLQQNDVTFRQSIVFEVDLEKHPWLATSKRRARPYFFIWNPESSRINWENYRNKPVRFTARAKQMIGHVDNNIRMPVLEVFLVPLAIRER